MAAIGIGAYAAGNLVAPGLDQAPASTATEQHAVLGPLVSSGDCAGLMVVAGEPNPGTVTRDTPFRPPLNPVALKPGDDNRLTMSGQDNLWLHANGPCLDRLVLRPSDKLVVRSSDDRDEPFNVEGTTGSAVLFTNTASDSTDVFTLGLLKACNNPNTCDIETLATVHGTVTGQALHPDGTIPTSTGTN